MNVGNSFISVTIQYNHHSSSLSFAGRVYLFTNLETYSCLSLRSPIPRMVSLRVSYGDFSRIFSSNTIPNSNCLSLFFKRFVSFNRLICFILSTHFSYLVLIVLIITSLLFCKLSSNSASICFILTLSMDNLPSIISSQLSAMDTHFSLRLQKTLVSSVVCVSSIESSSSHREPVRL